MIRYRAYDNIVGEGHDTELRCATAQLREAAQSYRNNIEILDS